VTVVPAPANRTAKAEATRQSIVDAALRLFRANGFDGTTMRAVADEAGVSLGNAYYYFGSKEHLVQAFYDQMQVLHAEASAGVLARETGFAARLEGLFEAWVDVAAPNHAFAGKFFKNAAEPTSPLSPFSPESEPARDASIALFRQALDGSDLKLAPALRTQMPELLWLLHMGVVLFWVHDSSDGQERTRLLARRVAPLVDKLARMTRLPVVRGVVTDLLELLADLRKPG
jgi:AcrR family transcriptional regulator